MTTEVAVSTSKPIVRIDRLMGDIFNNEDKDVVHFEAAVKFPDGTVTVSFIAYTRQQAIDFAKAIIRTHRPKDSLPPAYQELVELKAELWEPDKYCVGSEYVEIEM